MIKKEEIKVDLLFWWDSDCPAIIIEVEEDWVTVKYFDDFKKSDIIKINDIYKMKTCSFAEVQNYLKKRTKKLKDIVTKKTNELERVKKAVNAYQKNVKAFLKAR